MFGEIFAYSVSSGNVARKGPTFVARHFSQLSASASNIRISRDFSLCGSASLIKCLLGPPGAGAQKSQNTWKSFNKSFQDFLQVVQDPDLLALSLLCAFSPDPSTSCHALVACKELGSENGASLCKKKTLH